MLRIILSYSATPSGNAPAYLRNHRYFNSKMATTYDWSGADGIPGLSMDIAPCKIDTERPCKDFWQHHVNPCPQRVAGLPFVLCRPHNYGGDPSGTSCIHTKFGLIVVPSLKSHHMCTTYRKISRLHVCLDSGEHMHHPQDQIASFSKGSAQFLHAGRQSFLHRLS